MAGNLGARPLGPILIQRFERLFDGPPRVLKMNGKSESTSVGWLDVVEFARNKPEQFKMEHFKDGVKVCQFYTKQCRVEISEEDFMLVKSGMPQKLIPPQPIGEDEEKELGTLEILEKALGGCVHLADQGTQLSCLRRPITYLRPCALLGVIRDRLTWHSGGSRKAAQSQDPKPKERHRQQEGSRSYGRRHLSKPCSKSWRGGRPLKTP